MSTTVGRVGSRIEQIALHLKQRGHISEGTAIIEYGRFRLSDIIHRLRNERPDLLPDGHEIVTMNKSDTQGNRYGEYHLVSKASAEPRRVTQAARERVWTGPGYLHDVGYID